MTLRFPLFSLILLGLAGCGSKGGRAPTAPVISLAPTDALTTDDLVVSIVSESTDSDGDSITYSYKWLVDGLLRDDLTEATVPASETAKGEGWSVLVTASDGELESTSEESSVAILNTPAVVSLEIQNPDPASTDDLVAIATVEDADDDELSLTWTWTVDGAATSEDEDTVPADATAKGEEWEVSLVVSDGESEVSPESVEVLVLNALPTVTEVLVEPTEAYETSVLTASATTADADGDAVSVAWAWSVNGAVVADATANTLDGASFSKHDSVVATATPSDDEQEGAALDAEAVAILNAAPSITGVTLEPADLYEASTVICTPAGWVDVDGDTEAYLFAWEVNGAGIGETGETLDGASFSRTDTVACTATPSDGEVTGDAQTSATATVLNTPPVIVSAALSTTAPQEGDTITVTVSGATDEDGDTVTYQYAWYVDSAFVAATSELTSSSFSKGQSIWVEVTPYDGTDSGAVVTSDTATAQNTPPELASVTLTPDPVAYSGILSCLPGTASDADSDIVTYAYTWTVDGSPLTATTETLSNTWFLAGSIVSCSITPFDSEDSGTAVPSNAATVNHPPSVGNVVISPSAPMAADAITCQHDTPTDIDADSVSVSYAWTVDGIGATSTSSTLGTAVQRGDTVQCTVTPSDPYEPGTGGSASTTVVNTPPEVTSATLSPTNPTTDSPVTANAVASDLDGDSVSLNYAFYVNNALKQNSSSNELNGSAHFQRGDSVSVTITPQDTQHQGPDYTGAASVVVVNSPPTAPGLSISPTEPVEGVDPLTCSVDTNSTDADAGEMGDTISYTFDWTADSVVWTGAQTDLQTSSVISAVDVHTVTEWVCLVTPTDSYGEDGVSVEASMTIGCVQDEDCDGALTVDDCNDSDPTIYPYAGDTYGDGEDSDCDGADCTAGLLGSVYLSVCPSFSGSNSAAAGSCQSIGADGLRKIANSNEQAFVETLLSDGNHTGDFWIGIDWSDGSAYTNWNPGQPDGGQCAVIRTSWGYEWNDYGCSGPNVPICGEDLLACDLGTQSCPAADCLEILDGGNSTGDGIYWIDPDGDGADLLQVYCDMTYDGGGWTTAWGRSDSDLLLTGSDFGGYSTWTLSNTTLSLDTNITNNDAIKGVLLSATPGLSYTEIYSDIAWAGSGCGDLCNGADPDDGMSINTHSTRISNGGNGTHSYSGDFYATCRATCGGGQRGWVDSGTIMVR